MDKEGENPKGQKQEDAPVVMCLLFVLPCIRRKLPVAGSVGLAIQKRIRYTGGNFESSRQTKEFRQRMKYERITKGKFIDRPNRFIAHAEIQGKTETVHVKNTGRCAELLKPQAEIFLQESDNPDRKTKWDLIAVRKGERIVNMDSQVPNRVVKEWIEAGNFLDNVRLVKPEVTYGDSRFDLYVETDDKRIFIEIKGVTLEEKGEARFPDAPSERYIFNSISPSASSV